MLSDTALLDWVEAVGAQVWPTRDKRGEVVISWTVQRFIKVDDKRIVVQPTRPTLREAIQEAIDT